MIFEYRLCGLKVASDLPIPDLLPWSGDDRPSDVDILLGSVPDRLDRPIHEGPLLQIGADGICRFAVSGVAAYLVEGGRRVTVAPQQDPAAPDIRVFLLGTVFGFLCHQRGLLPLHASCVDLGGRAVAFAGLSGIGKSTLAAAFWRRGYPVPADDITVVDLGNPTEPRVLPAFPRIKLWRDAMEVLALPTGGLERSRKDMEKFHLPVPDGFGGAPLPLSAIYHLKDVPGPCPVTIKRLSPLQATATLTEDIYRVQAAWHMGRQTALWADIGRLASAVPIYELSRPLGWEALDATIGEVVGSEEGRGR